MGVPRFFMYLRGMHCGINASGCTNMRLKLHKMKRKNS